MTLPVLLSYGMGIDSSAILLRWLADPSSRDFDLSDLVVLTAMTGDEFEDTGRLVTTHILPRFRKHGVRFVQIARLGPAQEDGIGVLSDTRVPTEIHLRTAYRLSTELTAAGTIPQVATGRRLCSLHFKGWPLDTWIEGEFGRLPFRHVMGFNAGEQRRIDRDRSYSTHNRRTEYPLMECGWDRQRCDDYIFSVVGERWAKSCCTYCPFAQERHLGRYMNDPDAAVQAMVIEHRSLALNPRSTLFAKESVIELVRDSGNAAAMERFEAALDAGPWSLYEVRRGFASKKGDAGKKGPAFRSLRVHVTGSRAECMTGLEAKAAVHGRTIHRDRRGIHRFHLRHLRDTYPATEHYFVVGLAGAEPKERTGFATRWSRALRAEDAPKPTHWLTEAMRKQPAPTAVSQEELPLSPVVRLLTEADDD